MTMTMTMAKPNARRQAPDRPTHDRTRAAGDARRERIIDEAIKIIGERGYQGFSIGALAERCGLSGAGLLHHFGSKDQLLIAVLEDRIRRDEAAITASLGVAARVAAPSRELIIQSLRAIAQRNVTQPELVKFYATLRMEALNPAHPAHDYFKKRSVENLAIYSGFLRPLVRNAESSARMLMALLTGLEEQWLRDGEASDFVAQWDEAIALVLP